MQETSYEPFYATLNGPFFHFTCVRTSWGDGAESTDASPNGYVISNRYLNSLLSIGYMISNYWVYDKKVMFKNLQRAHLEKKTALQDFTKNPGWIDVGNM